MHHPDKCIFPHNIPYLFGGSVVPHNCWIESLNLLRCCQELGRIPMAFKKLLYLYVGAVPATCIITSGVETLGSQCVQKPRALFDFAPDVSSCCAVLLISIPGKICKCDANSLPGKMHPFLSSQSFSEEHSLNNQFNGF